MSYSRSLLLHALIMIGAPLAVLVVVGMAYSSMSNEFATKVGYSKQIQKLRNEIKEANERTLNLVSTQQLIDATKELQVRSASVDLTRLLGANEEKKASRSLTFSESKGVNVKSTEVSGVLSLSFQGNWDELKVTLATVEELLPMISIQSLNVTPQTVKVGEPAGTTLAANATWKVIPWPLAPPAEPAKAKKKAGT